MAQRAGGSKQSKGKKNRKLGRNASYSQLRASKGTEHANRVRRFRAHLRRCDKNLNDIHNQKHLQALLDGKA